MLKDIIDITDFALTQVRKNDCIKVARSRYDAYRTLLELSNKIDLVISRISSEIDHADIGTSFGTPTNKWLYFTNKSISDFENIKYRYFYNLTCVLYSENDYGSNENILKDNFLSKSLNGCIDEYTNISYIDDSLILYIYKFNLIKKDCPSYRHFEELFAKKSIDIGSDMSKFDFIQELKHDKIIFDNKIANFKEFLHNNYSIRDLL